MLLTIALIREETWNDRGRGTERRKGGRKKREKGTRTGKTGWLGEAGYALLVIDENTVYSGGDQWSG